MIIISYSRWYDFKSWNVNHLFYVKNVHAECFALYVIFTANVYLWNSSVSHKSCIMTTSLISSQAHKSQVIWLVSVSGQNQEGVKPGRQHSAIAKIADDGGHWMVHLNRSIFSQIEWKAAVGSTGWGLSAIHPKEVAPHIKSSPQEPGHLVSLVSGQKWEGGGLSSSCRICKKRRLDYSKRKKE